MQYDVYGMTCAACSARVEKAVRGVDGVTSCSVSLLTDSMSVEGSADSKKIIDAVKKAGYRASEKGKSKGSAAQEAVPDTADSKKLFGRLIISVLLLLALMYFSMGQMLFSGGLPYFLRDNYIGQGLVQLLLCLAVIIINKKFFVNGAKGIINMAPNMDTLVSMGSGVSFLYSLFNLFYMTYLAGAGQTHSLHDVLHGLYFG